eukprot:2438504-Karenia_brevis.AAC.1
MRKVHVQRVVAQTYVISVKEKSVATNMRFVAFQFVHGVRQVILGIGARRCQSTEPTQEPIAS